MTVTKSVGDTVERSWMISVEDPRPAVGTPVSLPVNQTWTNSDPGVVHTFASWHPPITDDVRPSCCALESRMTPGGCGLTHTVHRAY